MAAPGLPLPIFAKRRWGRLTIWRSPAHFQTLFVERIPALKTSQRNEAKRFVLLIDTLYDARAASRGLFGPAAGTDLSPGRPPV